MKAFIVLLFACLSQFSYADSDVTFSGDLFSPESLQKLYEVLESSTLPSTPIQLSSSASLSSVSIINDYADAVVTQIQCVLVQKGLDEVTLPDVSLSFKHKIALITYTGLLNLTEGNVTSISSIKRNGDVVISYNNKYLNLEVPLAFDELNINYHYKAKIMNIGPSGGVNGQVTSTTFKIGIGFNFTGLAVDLNEFTLTDIGDVELSFHGNSLLDWLLVIVTDLLIPLFKKTIHQVLEGNIYEILVSVVETLNETIQSINSS